MDGEPVTISDGKGGRAVIMVEPDKADAARQLSQLYDDIANAFNDRYALVAFRAMADGMRAGIFDGSTSDAAMMAWLRDRQQVLLAE